VTTTSTCALSRTRLSAYSVKSGRPVSAKLTERYLDFRSTTSDQTLITAMNFILANEQNPKTYLEATFDLSFASAKWLRTVMVRRKRKSWFRRQHLFTVAAAGNYPYLSAGACHLGFLDHPICPWLSGCSVLYVPCTVSRYTVYLVDNRWIGPACGLCRLLYADSPAPSRIEWNIQNREVSAGAPSA
jgi:hypothetical protein